MILLVLGSDTSRAYTLRYYKSAGHIKSFPDLGVGVDIGNVSC